MYDIQIWFKSIYFTIYFFSSSEASSAPVTAISSRFTSSSSSLGDDTFAITSSTSFESSYLSASKFRSDIFIEDPISVRSARSTSK
jgi:hypothetical protein